jgi:hypothetical protein
MHRRERTVAAPTDSAIAVMVAFSLLLFAWGLGEMLRSL